MNHERHEKEEKQEERRRRGKLLFREECFVIQGAIFDVYREMGSGFLEAVYQECLERELHACNVPFRAQPDVQLSYKGAPLKQSYRPDLICYNKIIVELKAVNAVAPQHEAQLLNYLKSTKMKLGLLVNFGAYPKATVNRYVL